MPPSTVDLRGPAACPRRFSPSAWPALLLVAALLVPLLWRTARADEAPRTEAPRTEAGQLAELFAETCQRFVGDPAALRGWLAEHGYRRLSRPREAALMQRPGQAYDVSTPAGPMLVLSLTNGWCLDVADNVDGAKLVARVDEGLRRDGIDFHVMDDSVMPGTAGRRRRYALVRAGRRIVLIVNVTPAGNRSHATLFLAPLE